MQFPTILAQIKDIKAITYVLAAILTPKELAEIERRIVILQRLATGEPQHQIAEDLGVGIATITRGSKVLKTNHYQAIKQFLCL